MRARFAHKPRTVLLCLAVFSLLAAACASTAPAAKDASSSVPSGPSSASREVAAPAEVVIPAEVVNSWGVTSTEAYLNIDRRQTADDPYGPLGGGFTIAIRPLVDLLGRSQAIVVGTVVKISPPYFNSVDGGFWHDPSSLGGRSILQNVTIEVERVLGDTADLASVRCAQKESIVVTIAGGQIEVTFDASVDPASLPEGLEPGRTYVQAMAPNVEVAEGDRVLVFLQMNRGPWFGAPLNEATPWGKTSHAGCPIKPLGSKDVVFGNWHHLGADGQQITVQERTVTVDQLAALAEAGLGQLLSDAAAPIGPGNGLPSFDDDPPRNNPPGSCNKPSHPPNQTAEPTHTHPEYEN